MKKERPRWPSSVSWLLVCCVALLASCSTRFQEKYYVGVFERGTSADAEQDGPTQFYRFRLDGWATLFSKTRYEAGWYDASVDHATRQFGCPRARACGSETWAGTPLADTPGSV